MPDHPSLFTTPPLAKETRFNNAERFDQYEVQREVSALLDGLLEDECRQVMAALGERYRLTITDKALATSRRSRPSYSRKRHYS